MSLQWTIATILVLIFGETLLASDPPQPPDDAKNPLVYLATGSRPERIYNGFSRGAIDPTSYSGNTAELQQFLEESAESYSKLANTDRYPKSSAKVIVHAGKSPLPEQPQWKLTVDQSPTVTFCYNFGCDTSKGHLDVTIDVWADNDNIKLSELTIPKEFDLQLSPEIETFITRHKRSWLKKSIETVSAPFKKIDAIRAQND